ncbi:MAG: saccharopine dehydrogenase NADP-binding domain-containing protein [Phycisphaerales bacterium]|nr:saccharopine dehydrogenase NADP-binding domain-containing protein [Phycisphaerales bacterium]
MPTTAVVLGTGMVGSVIAADLARTRGWKVHAYDASEESLDRCQARCEIHGAKPSAIKTGQADLSDTDVIAELIKPADIVVGAMPGRFGLATLETVIKGKKDYCDISFMPEDPLQFHELARRKGVTAVVDMGVAPGMCHLLSGLACQTLDDVQRIEILVAGLPRHRHWPFEYKAGFSPSDVIEEYIRPSRVVENGQVVVKEALSEPELVEFEGLGTLEAFNTDGLRSLIDTLDVPNMVEKTMRYPGHIELMKVFRETGFFSDEEIELKDGTRVRPLDVTEHLLFPKWTFEDMEPDVTVMRVTAEGIHGKVPTRLSWDLVDHLDPATGFTSMSRTTAFPAAAMARMIADGTFKARGVTPPEHLVKRKGLVDALMKDLAKRGVKFTARVETRDLSHKS